jgi:starch synthase
VSMLKAGLQFADAITTVSPTYAREIQTPEFGVGLDGVLRARSGRLTGILNGIDTEVWDPAKDSLLLHPYTATDLAGKARNKAALQKQLGLSVSAKAMLFGVVSRMTPQKGIDLVLEQLDAILAGGGQLAVLGVGEPWLQDALAEAARRTPKQVHLTVGFNEALAHRIEAGADCFLMPSRFEPCGLNQMYSQRYGTPPIARATGGLADTIGDDSTGFLFAQPSEESLVQAVRRALAVYGNPAAWREMQRAAMARDFSWDAAARRYADLYLRLATLEPA